MARGKRGKRNRNFSKRVLECSTGLQSKYLLEREAQQTVSESRFSRSDEKEPSAQVHIVEGFIANVDFGAKSKDVYKFILDTLELKFGTVAVEDAVVHHHLFPKTQYDSSHKGCGPIGFRHKVHFDHLLEMSQKNSLMFRRRNLKLKLNDKPPNDYIRNKIVTDETYVLRCLQVGSNAEADGSMVIQWQTNDDIVDTHSDNCNITFIGNDKRCFSIQFIGDNQVTYKIEFAFRHMQYFDVERDLISGALALTFRLQKPPQIWRKNRAGSDVLGIEELLSLLSFYMTPSRWFRTVDPTENLNVFGRCLDYRVLLFPDIENYDHLFNCLKKLSLVERIPVWAKLPMRSPVIVATNQQVKNALASWRNTTQYLPFAIQFAIEALVTNNRLDPVARILIGDKHQMNEFVGLLSSVSPQTACLALGHMLGDPSCRSIVSPVEVLQRTLQLFRGEYDCGNVDTFADDEDDDIVDEGDTIHRVFVTPLRICPQSDAKDLTNRVIREFIQHKDRFLRVSLMDEHFGSISQGGSDDIFELRMKVLVREGFSVAGRHFVFLGYSNSQMREHSCWFYDEAPRGDSAPTADYIRGWIGDLSLIKTVGKFGARLAQGFSASTKTLNVSSHEVVEMSDIERNGYCFSDGVGMMHLHLALRVCSVLGLERCPSGFQFRYGGCKGMFAVAPPNHPVFRNTGVQLAIRPSMQKFASNHTMLEIVGLSKTMPMYLNRQIIPILTAMGVTDRYLLQLHDNMLRYFATATDDNDSARNMVVLHGNVPVEDSRETVDQGTSLTSVSSVTAAFHMLGSGFDVTTEPFLHGVVSAIRNRMLLDLQLKARIFVPEAVCLYGVMDETESLNYGEVFVQYTDRFTGQPVCLQNRDVLVGRSPSLHPGDIRRLKTRYVSELVHLVDVVVFPSRGHRPHPNEMSGGDLDGDIYFVIYDEHMVKQSKKQFDPMDFTPVVAAPVVAASADGVIRSVDIGDFFVNYIKNDNLGQIAHAHVAFADNSEYGIENAKCIQLAALHSTAVDFAKTGVPADFPPEFHCKEFPDFMEKHVGKTYKSIKVLGEVYRITKQMRNSEKRRTWDALKCHDVDRDLYLSGSDKYIPEARQLLSEYNFSLWQIMCQYEVWDESELLSGFVCKFAARVSGEKGSFDIQGRLNRALKELRSHYLAVFWEGVEEGEGTNNVDRGTEVIEWESLLKASAWYQACYSHVEKGDQRPLLSFAWISFGCLCKIKQMAVKNSGVK